jgi:hypothetical protein
MPSKNQPTWTDANPVNQVIAAEGNVQTIKAQVALNGTRSLYLRLRITRP